MQNEVLDEELMREFARSFADEGWGEDEQGNLFLESEDGKSKFVYLDFSKEGETTGDKMVILQTEDGKYILQQQIAEAKIGYCFIVPSYKKKSLIKSRGCMGVFYGSDGVMSRERKINNLPKRIDMGKTVELFLKQVIEKDFSVPVLVELK